MPALNIPKVDENLDAFLTCQLHQIFLNGFAVTPLPCPSPSKPPLTHKDFSSNSSHQNKGSFNKEGPSSNGRAKEKPPWVEAPSMSRTLHPGHIKPIPPCHIEHLPSMESTLGYNKSTIKPWHSQHIIEHQKAITSPQWSHGTVNTHNIIPFDLSLWTPSPMYKELTTLTWAYVQTRERREKRCPQYRVFGFVTL